MNIVEVAILVVVVVAILALDKYRRKRSQNDTQGDKAADQAVAALWKEIERQCQLDRPYSFEDHLDAADVPYCATTAEFGARVSLASMNKFLRSLRRRGKDTLYKACMNRVRATKAEDRIPDEYWHHIDRI